MKVTHLITTIERGGAENQLVILVKEQIKAGLSVKIFPLKGQLELLKTFTALGAAVELDIHKTGFFKSIIHFSRVCKDADVIHAHLPQAELLGSLSVARDKLVITRHNSERFYPRGNKFLSILLSRFVNLRACEVIAISASVREFVYKTQEIPESRQVHVVKYGFESGDLEISTFPREELDHESDISKDTFLVGAVSRLAPQKDLSTTLRAFSKLLRIKPNVHLLIVGDGPEREILKQEANQLALGDKITWFGRSHQVLEIMKTMDIVVLSSLYEGFGLVLLESISVGTPVLATRNSAIPEVLGINSQSLFETGNDDQLFKKLDLYSDYIERTKLLTENTLRLKEFLPSRMGKEINQIYNQVIK